MPGRRTDTMKRKDYPGDRSAPRSKRAPDGFTIIELVAVVVIVATVSVTAFASFSGDAEYRLEVAARKVATDIRYAQQLAMDHRGTYTITFNTASDTYTLYDKNSGTIPAMDPFLQSDFIVELDAGVYAGVTIEAADFGGNNYIQFEKGGDLVSTGSVTIAYGSKGKKIEVLQTGLIVLSDVDLS